MDARLFVPMVAGTNSSPREPDKDKWRSMDGFTCLILMYCICRFRGRVVYSNNHATSCIQVVQCVGIYKTNQITTRGTRQQLIQHLSDCKDTIHVAFSDLGYI